LFLRAAPVFYKALARRCASFYVGNTALLVLDNNQLCVRNNAANQFEESNKKFAFIYD